MEDKGVFVDKVSYIKEEVCRGFPASGFNHFFSKSSYPQIIFLLFLDSDFTSVMRYNSLKH